MKLFRLSQLYAIKYKIAANAEDAEASIRKSIPMLWNYPNKLFNILKACAESDVSKAKTPLDNKAAAGNRFCRNLLSLINHVYSNKETISMGELREKLLKIVNLIEENKDVKIGPTGRPSIKGEEPTIQFPHVSALIHLLFPVNRKHDIKVRNELQGKARTGLSRILSYSLDILNNLQDLEVLAPEKFTYQTQENIDKDLGGSRFSPQRAQLSNNDIVDFIRQYGPEYGITSRDDWDVVFGNNPQLKEEMTTVINARNRGQYAANDVLVKDEISKILRGHQESQKATTPHFEGPK